MKCERKDILDILRSMDIEVTVENLDPKRSLADQGVDSLDMMNVYFGIEERFDIKIDESALEKEGWDSVDAIVLSVNTLLRNGE